MWHAEEANLTVLQAVNETIQNSSSGVREFLENEENKKRAWMSAPSDDSILGNLPPGVIALLSETDPGVTTTNRSSPITLNEWARLLTIVFYEVRVRRKMLDSAISLSRAQLDANIRADAVWTDDVEAIFNGKSHVAPRIDGVESILGALDTNCFETNRDGGALKSFFERSRSLFSNAKRRWADSGNLYSSSTSFVKDLIKFLIGSLEEDTELLNFTCREAQLDIVTEEPGTAGGEGLAPSARKRRRIDHVDSGQIFDVESLASSMEKGFESLLAALRPEPQASDQQGNSGARLGAARKFEGVLEMFERVIRKSDESTGVVKEYWDKLRFRLQGQPDDMS
jgi:hypothetical protein